MFKFNPVTGKLDLVGGGSSSTTIITETENTLLNVLAISGEFTVEGDQSIKIININTAANNQVIQSVTINSDGELIIGASATLEVA